MTPKVKKLIWNDSKAPVANCCIGVYLMSHDFDGWYWILTQQGRIIDMTRNPDKKLAAVQAAAQSDYAARIIAALDPAWLAALEADTGFDDATADKVLGFLADAVGAKDWTGCDGSESWDGDVNGTIFNILKAADVYEDYEGTMATHARIAALDAAVEAADGLAEAMETYFLSSIVTSEMYAAIHKTIATYRAAKEASHE